MISRWEEALQIGRWRVWAAEAPETLVYWEFAAHKKLIISDLDSYLCPHWSILKHLGGIRLEWADGRTEVLERAALHDDGFVELRESTTGRRFWLLSEREVPAEMRTQPISLATIQQARRAEWRWQRSEFYKPILWAFGSCASLSAMLVAALSFLDFTLVLVALVGGGLVHFFFVPHRYEMSVLKHRIDAGLRDSWQNQSLAREAVKRYWLATAAAAGLVAIAFILWSSIR